MAIIKVDAFQCERCGHIWVPRNAADEREPAVCPKCKSPYWNRPRRDAKDAGQDTLKARRKRSR